jgi:hypothetical protein
MDEYCELEKYSQNNVTAFLCGLICYVCYVMAENYEYESMKNIDEKNTFSHSSDLGYFSFETKSAVVLFFSVNHW